MPVQNDAHANPLDLVSAADLSAAADAQRALEDKAFKVRAKASHVKAAAETKNRKLNVAANLAAGRG